MIQIDMPMPESCVECRFSQGGYMYCHAMPENFCGYVNYCEEDGRPEWCPLKAQEPVAPDISTVSGWISVKDRLPDRQTPVIVYVPPYSDDKEKYIGYVGMAYYTYSARGGYWAGTDGNAYGAIGIIHKPTHWMRMPEPPKEGKECD